MPTKKTKNQIAFEREVKRLTRFVKQAEKQGVYFPEPPVPAVMPKRVTKKALQRLQLMTKSEVQSKGYIIDTATGEVREEYKPAPSKKRYLSQIKPLMTEREKIQARKQAKAKELTTKRVNAIMKQWKIPKSAEKVIRKLVLSEDYSEDEKTSILRKIAKFYNPHEFEEGFRWELPEAEPEEEKPIKTRRPVEYDEDEEAEFFDVPSPDDFDVPAADGYEITLERLKDMLNMGNNPNTAAVINDLIDEQIERETGATQEEKRKSFVDRISPNINKIRQRLYEAFTKNYGDEVANAAIDAIFYIVDAVDADIQRRIKEAAYTDAPRMSTVGKYNARLSGWIP